MAELKTMDELKLFRGDDYVINDKIAIKQPTIGEIVDYGESEYFRMVNGLCSTPSDMMVELTEMGIDFVTLQDYDLFRMLVGQYTKEQTSILLGDIDLSSLDSYDDLNSGEIVLYNEESQLKIDRLIYQKIVEFIRLMHGMKANHDVPATDSARRVMIELAKQDAQMAARKKHHSNLKNLISGMTNVDGYNYTLKETFDLTIYQFMDCVHRVQAIKQADAMLHGIYGGMIDTSKMTNKDDLNWLRDL